MKGKYILGKVDYYRIGRRNCQAVLEWELTDDGRFSMSGDIWNNRHTDIVCGGQCVDEVVAYFPHDKKAQRMCEVWKRWHLNDMKAGCEHQRAWDTNKPLKLLKYAWTMAYYEMMQKAEKGTLSTEDYAKFQEVAKRVNAVLYDPPICHNPQYPFPEVQNLINEGWLEEKGSEEKTAGWVNQDNHPEGLLEKPCPVCSYKYGTAWLKEELPQDIIAEIKTW